MVAKRSRLRRRTKVVIGLAALAGLGLATAAYIHHNRGKAAPVFGNSADLSEGTEMTGGPFMSARQRRWGDTTDDSDRLALKVMPSRAPVARSRGPPNSNTLWR